MIKGAKVSGDSETCGFPEWRTLESRAVTFHSKPTTSKDVFEKIRMKKVKVESAQGISKTFFIFFLSVCKNLEWNNRRTKHQRNLSGFLL